MTSPFETLFKARFPYLYSLIQDLEPLPLKIPHFVSLGEKGQVYLFVGIDYAHFDDLILKKALAGKEIIFLEKDLQKIKGIFKLPAFCNLLTMNCIKIEYDEGIETLKKLAWNHLGEDVEIIGGDPQIKHQIEKIFQGVGMVASEFKDFGAQTFHNVFQNILQTDKIRFISDLFGKFRNIPAIICGAGPSLDQDIDELKKWNSHALIFAGGATLEALAKHQIEMHFAAVIDPNSNRSRFLQFTQFDTPFFVQFRMSKSIYRDIHGEKVWAGSSPGFFLEEALYHLLGLPKVHFDGGWVVSNFLAQMAYLLGCSPIIFVGMDHCWKTESTYEKNVSDQTQISGFKAQDMKGQEVWTKADFFWAQDWFSEFARTYTDAVWINATSEGLPMREVRHSTLATLWDEIGPSQHSLRDLVYQKIQEIPAHTMANSQQIFQVLIQSVQNCQEYCQLAIHELEILFGKSPEDLLEIEQIVPDIEKELFYQSVLVPMWEIWKYPHLKSSPYHQITKVILFLDVLDRYRQILIY